MRQLASALELWFNDLGGYPSLAGNLVPTYIGVLPTAPTPQDGPCTSGNNTYTYATSGTGFTSPNSTTATVYPGYSYTFCLGGLTGGYQSSVHTLTQAGIQ